MTAIVKWVNSDRLIREIEQAPEAVGEAIADELDKAGEEIRAKAQQKTPVRTGALRESIKKRTSRRGAKTSVKVYADYPKTAKFHKKKTRKQAAGSRVYYAFAVEYGTKHQAAQPFLIPAAREVANTLPQRLERAMNAKLDKVIT